MYLDITLRVRHCCCSLQVYSMTARQLELKCFGLKDLQYWTMEVRDRRGHEDHVCFWGVFLSAQE